MKTKTVCILLFLFVAHLVSAQNLQVQYQEVISMEQPKIEVDNPEIAAMIASQLKNMRNEMILLYHQGKSLYKPFEQKVEDEALSPNQSGIKFTMNTKGGIIYKDQESQQVIKQDYIMDRQFLITDSFPTIEWKLENETKEIAGYVCQKAVSGKGVTAWYSTDLPINAGPSVFHGLPGLILRIENDPLTIEAQSVETVDGLTEELRVPTGGKKISQEAFDKLKQKKMGEMGGLSKEGVTIKIVEM